MTVPTHQARDPHADALVASVARAAGAVTDTRCPEAEVLALYAERELSPDERGAVEAHVASCGRCQATVAAFVRGTPESAGPDADLASTVPWWAGWRWMVPLASATAVMAVAVWIGQGPAEQVASAPPPAAEVAAGAPPAVAEGRTREEVPARKADAQAIEEREAQNLTAGRVRAALPRDAGAATAASVRDSAKNSADKRIDGLAVDERREMLAKAETDQLETSRQRPSSGLTQEASAAAAGSAAAQAAQAAAPAVAGLAAEAPAVTRAPARADNDAGRRLADGAQSSAQALGWRLRDGVVERSRDQGKTWTRTTSPTPDRLVSVSATDARTAVVTTGGGARFTTSDGGATWRPLP